MPDNKYFIQLNILFVFYIKLFFPTPSVWDSLNINTGLYSNWKYWHICIYYIYCIVYYYIELKYYTGYPWETIHDFEV